jgi:anaerobic dimethyl sulfoxide reductase subunit C (anchor subunit)
MNDEGTLIAFTLFSQMIIGSTLVYVLIYFISMDEIAQLSSGFSLRTPEFLLLLGLLAALFISFLHLGRPSNAIHALNNLKTSWISREIFTLTLFSIGLLMLFIARWLGAGRSYLTASFILSAIAALLFLLSMVRLYMIPAVSTWNNWLTPIHFTLTALISGLVLMLVFVMLLHMEFIRLKPIIMVLMLLLLFEMVHAGFLFGHLNSMNFNSSNPFISEGIFKPITIIRMALIGLAMVCLILVFIEQKTPSQSTLLIVSISLIIIEMVVGRFVFFATFDRIGI